MIFRLFVNCSGLMKSYNLERTNLVLSFYVTFSLSRSVRCETKELPAMRVRIEGYIKKTPNAIQ